MTDEPDRTRLGRDFPALTLLFSFAHFFAILSLFVVLFAVGMRRFDRGGNPAPWESAAEMIMKVLAFPLVYVRAYIRMPVLVEFSLIVLNSVLWGASAARIVSRYFPAKKP